ncbi:MAG TPA: PAC2 family protein [Methanothrix sp.]|jgi:proteasome assembly chaperone (PAC2) family protein|nr:PAC2 family protein [Methanothrix sp.]HOU69757.1 PAC2 family protein [Methanothrix sp.]HQE96624.1 PAC2 family protein [Methanothrix sp.]HQJ78853.1 PAC2 family protein [Methanothrix sp.]
MFESGSICICGLPGIGSVGKVAADFLATSLQCSSIKPFFSSRFPPQVMVSDGLAALMHSEILRPSERENLLILSGDAQPMDVVGMYEMAGEILEALKEQGVTDVITLAAYVGDAQEAVLGAATDLETAAQLLERDIPLLKSGAIGGLNGLLAGLAPRYGMRGLCLLATTSGSDPVDLQAAVNLLSMIEYLLKLKLDLSLLSSVAEPPEDQTSSDVDMNYR